MGADSGRSLSLPALVARSRLPDGPLPALPVRCGVPGIGRWCRASKSQGMWSGMEEPVGGERCRERECGKDNRRKGDGGGKQQGRRTQCTAPLLWHSVPLRTLGVFERRFVRYGQLLAAFGTACGQHLPTVGGSHSLTETVLVDSLPARGLECSFHCHSSILFIL